MKITARLFPGAVLLECYEHGTDGMSSVRVPADSVEPLLQICECLQQALKTGTPCKTPGGLEVHVHK